MSARLGAFSDDLDTDFGRAAALASGYGIDGLAVRNVHGRNIAALTESEIRTIGRQAKEHDLEIASIGSQLGRGYYLDDPEVSVTALTLLENLTRVADTLDTRLVRVFALWLRGQEPLTEWRRRPDLDSLLAPLVEALSPAVSFAERVGLTLMFELEGASYVGTVAEAARLFQSLDSPAVALCWDVCNGWWSGETPEDGLRLLAGLPVVDVQTKDVPADPANPSVALLTRAAVGQGDVGYDRILPTLVASGYEGWITAERVHHPVRPEAIPSALADTLADIDGLVHITRPAFSKETR